MPRPIAWTIWTTAIAAAAIAIVSVASRPESAPAIAVDPPEDPPAQATRPAQDDKAKKAAAESYIQEAHRAQLDDLLTKMEDKLPADALWDLLQVGRPLPSPLRPLGPATYLEKERWKAWRKTLHEVDEAKLDRPRKVLFRSAGFWIDRALNAPAQEDPLGALRILQTQLEVLVGHWSRLDPAKEWQPAMSALANALAQLEPPQALRKPQRKTQQRLLRELAKTLTRFT